MAFDSADVLCAIAALQLLPENADRTLRLEALAHIAASIPHAPGRPRITPEQLLTICNSELIVESYLAWGEDPCDNPFTESFSFFGGSYVVFPGIVEESSFIVRHLAKSLFLSQERFPDAEFQQWAYALIRLALEVSNAIAQRAGLERGIEPISSAADVTVPEQSRFECLKEAVTFNQATLKDLLTRASIPSSTLDLLRISIGQLSLEHYQLDSGQLFTRPFVEAKNELVVAVPSALLPAVRHSLVNLAGERGVIGELARRYNGAVWNTVIKSLSYTNNEFAFGGPPWPGRLAGFRDGFFHLDRDKLLYVLLVTDSFEEYEPEVPFGTWASRGLQSTIVDRLRSVETSIYGINSAPNEVVFLLLHQGIGRHAVLGFGDFLQSSTSFFLGMTAADLETIALLEGGNPLALAKFARASDKVRKSTKVVATGCLDEYFTYRKAGYSYYLADEIQPTLLCISPGGAGELRREVLRQRDWHAAPAPLTDHHIEETSLHSTRSIPIYVPMSKLGKQVLLLVEKLPLPVWIIGPEYEDEGQQQLHSYYAQFADMFGYWLWQLTPFLHEILEPIADVYSRLVLELQLPTDERWHRRPSVEETGGDEIDITTRTQDGTLVLTVGLWPQVTNLLYGPDNSGEREILKHLLTSIRSLPFPQVADKLSDDAISAILDCHTPLGKKKKLLLLSTDIVPDLDRRGLPPYRKVQEADENELLDELGTYLSDEKGLRSGSIPDRERTKILREVVAFFYRKMERLVVSINPNGLLEWLIAHQETITHERAFLDLTIPTRLACFESDPAMGDQLQEEIAEVSKAASVSRFVIEYTAARPPSGFRPISLHLYDYLQGLSSQIVNFGMLSDFIHFKLADIKMSMLSSGRLGMNRELFAKAMEAYSSTMAVGRIASAVAHFGRNWRELKSNPGRPDIVDRLDDAMTAELGHSLTDLITLMVEAAQMSADLRPEVGVIREADLVHALIGRLNWPRQKIEDALLLLSLSPRSDFLVPPEPWRKEDTFPWRLNRPLSYVRRPFLRRHNNGEWEVLFGPRHLHNAGQFLMHTCLAGRIRAQSPEMRRLVGQLNNEQGVEFNDAVADLLQKKPGVIVRRRVKKIGKDGKPPGDIDVLVADSARQCLQVVECKDLTGARTPYEMANELAELVQGSGSKKSIVEKLQERASWTAQHMPRVLSWLGLPSVSDWAVEPLIVVSQDLMTPHFHGLPIPILSLRELRRKQAQDT